MIKKIKPAILFLIYILFLQDVCGQVSMTMTDQLSHKLQNYVSTVPREEIFLHSDRDEYISGEDIWFNVYLLDRQSLKPSGESKIAYFELLNPENRPIVQKRLWLENGSGPGQIVLPDTLSTGTYTIRAYTNWMKNFLPYNCFSKEVKIFNAFSNRSYKERKKTESNTSGEGILNYPSTINQGVTLRANNNKPDVLDLEIRSDEKYRDENNNLVYLIILTRGNVDYASTERITEGSIKISVPKRNLSPGINQITVFNLKGQPVGERYIYTPVKTNGYLSVNSVDSTGLRKKVSLELKLPEILNPGSHTTNLSISVSPVTPDHSRMDISDYMIFGSEFVFTQGLPFKNISLFTIPAQMIDSLLLNARSNWINWNLIIANDHPVFKYQPEKDDHYLSGKLLSNDQKMGIPDRFVLLTSPGKIPVFQYAKTDENGDFYFRLHIDEKVKDLMMLPDIIDKNQIVSIESSFSDQYVKTDLRKDSLNKTIPEYIPMWSVNHQVRKIYGASSEKDSTTPVIPTPRLKRFYGKPDIELVMKDYITLPVMQEVFFELLAGVSLKSKKAGYEITIANPENNNKPYDNQPGLFIDGVAIKDASLIAALDPEIVERIDVVNEKYYVGDYMFYGLVNVITKNGDFSNVVLPDYTIRLPYRVIDPVCSFISPDYSSAAMKKSRIPDFRNTLYWNPSVRTDKTGKANLEFWTSDFVSDYEINIQGITSDGKSISLKKIIRVKN